MRSLLIGVLVASATDLAAQVDYRNLDAERPLRTEDAYALERGAVEFTVAASRTFAGATDGVSVLVPEVAFGFDNLQVTAAWPFAQADGSARRSLGPRLGLLYNPFTQPRRWPALAFRLDGAALEGTDGALDARVTGKLIATRSFGVSRMHVNAAFTAGPETPKYEAEFPARATATLALDRSLWRQSVLLGIETGVEQEMSGADAAWVAGAGLRWQWTPVTVVDLGYHLARSPGRGTSHSAAFGFTYVTGRGRPSRRPAVSRPPALERRDEQFYAPGGFNWRFLERQNEAARFFNAFDYGHAVLYERLLTERGAALEASLDREYHFLTTDLLVRPPRYQMAEEAVMPRYAEEFWRAKQVFEWAHVLHRQIYDVYANREARGAGHGSFDADSAIEALTDRYLERREYALAAVPKAMVLMDGQPYSGVFARSAPRFNGLIWAYHWLQVGLYEPYARQRPPILAPVLARFRDMVATGRFPEVMPMTSAVAPAFTTAHPRAAAIFDNLHALHDVISDILLNDAVVPRAGKRAAVWRALAEYQDATRDVEADDHWRMMGEMMGGVARMGGAVP